MNLCFPIRSKQDGQKHTAKSNVALDLPSRHQFVPAIILFLAIGVVGRVISFGVAGRPADSLVNGLIVEIINAGLTAFFYARYRQEIVKRSNL